MDASATIHDLRFEASLAWVAAGLLRFGSDSPHFITLNCIVVFIFIFIFRLPRNKKSFIII